MHIIHVGGSKEVLLVKMSATDRNSLVPLDLDLVYTSPLKARVTSVRNISAIHTGENAIILSSMWYFLGLNYCGAQLFIKYLYDWKRNIEPHDNQSLFTICKLALSQLILGARKEIDTCNYFAVELSALSQENLSKTVICLKTGSA